MKYKVIFLTLRLSLCLITCLPNDNLSYCTVSDPVVLVVAGVFLLISLQLKESTDTRKSEARVFAEARMLTMQ